MSGAAVGIVVATFLSDAGHEMATAVLPLYLGSIGLGATALGALEGISDLVLALAKLSGGLVGHRVRRKKALLAAGYLVTALGSAGMGLARTAGSLASLRATAWLGRGFRSPLRDALLADAAPKTHLGRVFGFERTADMLGAVSGPLIAAGLLFLHVDVGWVILISFVPSFGAFLAIVLGTTDPHEAPDAAAAPARASTLPAAFWYLLPGVLLFGLGDFSRSFLVLLAGQAFHAKTGAILLYMLHNVVSSIAAFPAGRAGDSRPKLDVLLVGYGLGVVTNVILAIAGGDVVGIGAAVILSGVYIAIEETIEKATAAELLTREQRTLGFGVLAASNAVGDMLSSLFTGAMLDAGRPRIAFGVPAALGLAGLLWLLLFRRKIRQA
jgi:MFS family permease